MQFFSRCSVNPQDTCTRGLCLLCLIPPLLMHIRIVSIALPYKRNLFHNYHAQQGKKSSKIYSKLTLVNNSNKCSQRDLKS